MKGRESGMPEQKFWETFFNTPLILECLEINASIKTLVELGSGYGTFTIPVAKQISGQVIALDIESDLVRDLRNLAQEENVTTICAEVRDFMEKGTGVKSASVDYVMAFNLLHIENPVMLLKEAYRILRDGGKFGVIHWNYDATTPRGPSLAIRPTPEQCVSWATEVGLKKIGQFDFKPFHYGLLFQK